MRKGQDRKVKGAGSGSALAGRASCLGLLALSFALLDPMMSSFVFAEEIESNGSDGSEVGPSKANYDDQTMTTSETDSTVSIAFLPTSANGAVTPVSSSGDKAKVDVKATVRVQNSGGYQVYVGSSSSQLTNGANTIDSVSAATTYANLPVNSWGYAFIKNGASSTDSTTYNAMPATLRSTALDANTNTNITDETRTYTLSFAANIGNDKPAGKYTNSVTMSVVSSPLVVAEELAYDFGGITTMQAMTTAICNAAPTGGVKQLQDTRDGKYYWVGKMKDGKCWMTQNLDLDLSTGKDLTPDDTDIITNYTPAYDTAMVVNADNILASNTGQRSWSLGDYSIVNPNNSTSCGSGLESAAACSGSGTKDRFKYYVTPTTANGDTNAHYILGNHYQWNAATAGTGGVIKEGQASGSICPQGWKLPEANTNAAGSFGGLVDAYSVGSNTGKLVGVPLYFVRSGRIYQHAELFNNGGNVGYYWSSIPVANGTNAYDTVFWANNIIYPSNSSDARNVGLSVRCIAR